MKWVLAVCAIACGLLTAGGALGPPRPMFPADAVEGTASGPTVQSPIGSPVLYARVTLNDRESRMIGSPEIRLTGPAGEHLVQVPAPESWVEPLDRAWIADLPGSPGKIDVLAIRPGQWLLAGGGKLWFRSRASFELEWLGRHQQRQSRGWLITALLATAAIGVMAASKSRVIRAT